MNKPESKKVSIKINEVSKSRILEVVKKIPEGSTTDREEIKNTRVRRST